MFGSSLLQQLFQEDPFEEMMMGPSLMSSFLNPRMLHSDPFLRSSHQAFAATAASSHRRNDGGVTIEEVPDDEEEQREEKEVEHRERTGHSRQQARPRVEEPDDDVQAEQSHSNGQNSRTQSRRSQYPSHTHHSPLGIFGGDSFFNDFLSPSTPSSSSYSFVSYSSSSSSPSSRPIVRQASYSLRSSNGISEEKSSMHDSSQSRERHSIRRALADGRSREIIREKKEGKEETVDNWIGMENEDHVRNFDEDWKRAEKQGYQPRITHTHRGTATNNHRQQIQRLALAPAEVQTFSQSTRRNHSKAASSSSSSSRRPIPFSSATKAKAVNKR